MLLRRHMSFYLAALCGVVTLLTALLLKADHAEIIAADVFFVVYLALALRLLAKLTPNFLKKHAASTDEPVWIIFLVTFATVVVAFVSLFLLVNQHPRPDTPSLLLALSSVPLGWGTIHMMAAVHYAHMYWQPYRNADGKSDRTAKGHDRVGGLGFPNSPDPEGWDFAYYSYVIGMTGQTSDTSVTTTYMRRISLLHSVVAFFFNTVIVAAAVNVAVALGS